MVGHTKIDGYKVFILHDIWNLFDGVTNINAPDMDSGHCRVIKIRAEDLPKYFDLIVVSRFPDTARMGAKSAKLKPWKTGIGGVVVMHKVTLHIYYNIGVTVVTSLNASILHIDL